MLNLTGYKLTFDDEFNSISISQGAGTVWSDIRPGSRMSPYADIGFGDSAFVDSASGLNPFSLQNGALDITAVPAGSNIVGPGHWASGLISTEYSFAQQYGYFEIRAMLPNDVGVWPAFWMLPAGGAWPPELDVSETYGDTSLWQTVHTNQTGTHTYQQVWSNQPSMTSGYHTFGMLWDAENITFYFDGSATGQLPTPTDLHQPMYLLADLAMQALSGVASSPKHLYIDYIRAYSNDPNSTEVALAPISSPDGVDTSSLYGAQHAVSYLSMNNHDLIEALYVSYFGRAGDPAGVKFWLAALDSGYSASAAAVLFSEQIEAQNQYPVLANSSTVSQAQITSFINSIYQDLFNRNADPGGLDFWQKYLETNLNDSHSVGTFIHAVVTGAQNGTIGQDQITMTNKVAAARFLTDSFANAGINFNESSSPANTFAHSNIAEVSSDPATVVAAAAEVSAFLHSAIGTSLVGVTDAVASSHV